MWKIPQIHNDQEKLHSIKLNEHQKCTILNVFEEDQSRYSPEVILAIKKTFRSFYCNIFMHNCEKKLIHKLYGVHYLSGN